MAAHRVVLGPCRVRPAVPLRHLGRRAGTPGGPSSPERDPGRKVAALVRTDRAQVRDALGFRPATRADEEALAGWLAAEVAPAEPSDDRLRETLLTRCRNEHLEPPGRVDRLVASARATATDRFCAATVARLYQGAADRLERLVADVDPTSPGPRQQELLAELKADPGRASLETLLSEVNKLERVRALGLPADLFDGATDTLISAESGGP